jgi:hypothetical protein
MPEIPNCIECDTDRYLMFTAHRRAWTEIVTEDLAAETIEYPVIHDAVAQCFCRKCGIQMHFSVAPEWVVPPDAVTAQEIASFKEWWIKPGEKRVLTNEGGLMLAYSQPRYQ